MNTNALDSVIVFTSAAATPPPASQLAADSIVEAINNEIKHRVAVHKTAWETLWENIREGATPEAILEHIAACAALVGKQASDFIEPRYLSSPRELVHHNDGRVTLAPQ